MSLSHLITKYNVNICMRNANTALQMVRKGHWMRGKRPGEARTLEQRLEGKQTIKQLDRVNIGFPKLKLSRSEQLKERLAHLKAQKMNTELEKKARSNDLSIDLKQVENDYRNTTGQFDLRRIADHYGIFNDLFGNAYFVPRVPLDIKYQLDNDNLSPVFSGNVIRPSEAAKKPLVSFNSTTNPITGEKETNITYWTLVATNPDGNLKKSDAECLHWFVANIPNGDLDKGEELVNYLPPFPPKGLGYQRIVFVLYKQNAKMDFNSYKLATDDYANLDKRSFVTLDFYRKYQDDITPAGLSFFQSNWDHSITDFYHNVLNMKEPIYEYDFPQPYLSDQKFFPLKQPFNLYMDKHRDIKQVNKEFLERKLAKTHPFEGPEKPLRFPNAHPLRGIPSWLITEKRKARLRMGRINDY